MTSSSESHCDRTSGTVPHIKICAARDSLSEARQHPWTHIISIRDPTSRESWQHKKTAKRVRQFKNACETATVTALDFYDNSFVGVGVVREIVAMAASVKSGDCILIHCMMGISRSSAAAVIVLRECGLSHEEAMSVIVRERPIAQPNDAMLAHYEGLIRGHSYTLSVAASQCLRMLVENRAHFTTEVDCVQTEACSSSP